MVGVGYMCEFVVNSVGLLVSFVFVIGVLFGLSLYCVVVIASVDCLCVVGLAAF